MSALIGPEQVEERPQTSAEMAEATKLLMLQALNLNLRLTNRLLDVELQQLADQAAVEAEAWGNMMKILRERGVLS